MRYYGYSDKNKSYCLNVIFFLSLVLQSVRFIVFSYSNSNSFNSVYDTPLFFIFLFKGKVVNSRRLVAGKLKSQYYSLLGISPRFISDVCAPRQVHELNQSFRVQFNICTFRMVFLDARTENCGQGKRNCGHSEVRVNDYAQSYSSRLLHELSRCQRDEKVRFFMLTVIKCSLGVVCLSNVEGPLCPIRFGQCIQSGLRTLNKWPVRYDPLLLNCKKEKLLHNNQATLRIHSNWNQSNVQRFARYWRRSRLSS